MITEKGNISNIYHSNLDNISIKYEIIFLILLIDLVSWIFSKSVLRYSFDRGLKETHCATEQDEKWMIGILRDEEEHSTRPTNGR